VAVGRVSITKPILLAKAEQIDSCIGLDILSMVRVDIDALYERRQYLQVISRSICKKERKRSYFSSVSSRSLLSLAQSVLDILMRKGFSKS
jgi:hypothetical protein